jgi:hypothetical protein
VRSGVRANGLFTHRDRPRAAEAWREGVSRWRCRRERESAGGSGRKGERVESGGNGGVDYRKRTFRSGNCL